MGQPTFLLFLLLLWPCVVSENLQGNEVAYMKKLRKAISPAPPDWFTQSNMCDWSHVTCTDITIGLSSIESINLMSKSLKGELPPGLNNSLRNLKTLVLTNNNLTGPVPSFAGLSILQVLDLGFNNFTSVPDGAFQGLIRLQPKYDLVISLAKTCNQEFRLDNNTNLAPWTFPATLSASSKLNQLSLTNANLVGSLPDAFHSFRDLEYLGLSQNSLTGSLPNSITKLLTLQSLHLENQQNLSGKRIPFIHDPVGIREPSGEQFPGSSPDLSNCTNLTELKLHGNQFTGVVPPSLMNLSSLEEVSLDNNYLQGPMPAFNENVSATLEGNGFCLNQPGRPCDHRVTTLLQVAEAFAYPLLLARTWRGNNPCKRWSFITCDIQGKIRTLNLTNLNLNGTISPAFANLTDLRELYLGRNNLTDSIPESLTALSQLKILDVSNNNLSGSVPRFSPNTILNTANNSFLVWSSLSPIESPPAPPLTSLPSPATPSTNKASPTTSRSSYHLWIKLGTI
ncbi:hypothetical protein PIB30_025751 [Stylosanthes scabra]|uniref:Leucine-rich repeat-containing N-terminal plant-type domain-containing protein n=1 Tax=Stylosanthes scabra TaxID=79078 RepID=A0ABU6RAU9_9FABA|nr:hypothetical protein [Stylosanthes scabra]